MGGFQFIVGEFFTNQDAASEPGSEVQDSMVAMVSRRAESCRHGLLRVRPSDPGNSLGALARWGAGVVDQTPKRLLEEYAQS